MESYYTWCVVLFFIILGLKYINKQATASQSPKTGLLETEDLKTKKQENNTNDKFFRFQRSYLLVFLTVMLADWMQGPYVYKLYERYNYQPQEIAILFVIGFGTSGIFGTFIGTFADRFGRKLTCILFCICYCACCMTKHFHNYSMLLLGRFLGGISTSILFSCFEAWMVSHHNNQNFARSKLGSTFELAWGLNSVVAVAAGFITSFAVKMYTKFELFEPAEVAAFDCSAIVLLFALLVICYDWTENENTSNSNMNVRESLMNAVHVFQTNLSVSLVGCIQSGFEAAMYLFVFMWTLALESVYVKGDEAGDEAAGVELDHGMIFAVFMEACFVGTIISGLLAHPALLNWSSERISIFVCVIAAPSLCLVPFTNSYQLRLFLFILFECCVGIYFPTIGNLRSHYIPEEVRATVMNIFRVPLNIIVVCTLWYLDSIAMYVFQICGVLLFVAAFAAYNLHQHQKKSQKKILTQNDI